MTNPTNSKVALITGGSRGLGRSMALHLADRGVDSIITYRAREDAAAAVVAEIEAKGRKAVALPLDVAKSASFAAFATSVSGALSRTWSRDRFDYLVNNGGGGAHVSFLETTEETFDQMMLEHLKGPYFLTQKLAPLVSDGGRIINISTGLTRVTFPGSSVYAIMKAGLETLTRYLASELAARKILVNTIAPGAIATDFRDGAIRDNPEASKRVASFTALGRVGQADDVGGAVASLLTGENGWITGQRIEVSGGLIL